MRRKVAVALALAVLLALTFLVGRTTAPTRERVVEVTSVREKVAEAKTTTAASSSLIYGSGYAKQRDHKVTRPDGTVEETHEVETGNVNREEKREASSIAETKTAEREKLVYRERVAEAAKPSWAVGVSAGVGLDLRPRYQGEIARRIVGGLWLTVTVDVSGRAALAGLRMEF